MKQSLRYRIGFLLLSVVFALGLSWGIFSLCSARGGAAEGRAQDPQFSEIGLEGDEYAKGTLLPVPSVKMTLDGKEYVALAVLHRPDGTAGFASGTVSLDMAGAYSIEYKATVDAVTYSKEETFTVYQPKFEFSGGDGIAEYRENAVEGMNGEYISLEEGQTLTIYDYFDITQATASEPIFEASIIPETVGSENFQTLTVRFVSKKNPDQYLEIVGNYYDYNNCTYFLAGSESQTVTGYESSQGTIHVGNTWGAPYSGSFRGQPNNNMTLSQDTFKIYLDYETKCVYANFAKGFVIDLDDPQYFGTLWEGFDDGEVYVEVSGSRYLSSKPAQLLILKAGDIDLREQEVRDTTEPEITIDYGDYSKESLPVGVKGKAYAVFDASAEDYLSGACTVDVHVWARYYMSQRYEVEVDNGAFVPDAAGNYIIEYVASDDSGNVARERVSVNVVTETDPVTISLSGGRMSGKVGEYFTFSEAEAKGGSGNLSVRTEVTLDGASVQADANGFRAERIGNYEVTVTATDYLGQQDVQTYTVAVVANDSPVFIDDIVLPKYLIAGSRYTFEEVYAYDYSSGNGGTKIKATLVTEDANGVQEHADDQYTPNAANHLDSVKIYYRATLNGKTAQSEPQEIKVCVVGTGSNVDISKYFIPDGVSVEATAEGMRLSALREGGSVDFANPILANGLTYAFNVDPAANSFRSFHVYLRDSVNADECIKLSYTKGTQLSSYLSVNDGLQYTIPASFFGTSSYEFVIRFDNKTCVFSYETSVRITATQTLSGDAFHGFSSGKVYVTFEFSGAGQGDAAVILSELGGQRTTSVKADLIKPKIDLVNELSGRYSIGDVVELTTAIAVDVLDPNITSSYTVYAPDGSIAKDVNGMELASIPVNESYSLCLDHYGVYRVSFAASDWNGREETTFSYVLEVADAVPPVIVLNGDVPTEAAVGDTIAIPLARAVDLIDGTRDVYAYILCPDGRFRAYGSELKYDTAGEYQIIYYAFDESGNTAKLVYTVNVK